MSITYSIAIDLNDDGDYTDTNEPITPDVVAMRWRLGMDAPFDSVAAPSTAQITIRNPERSYSPEYTTLLPGKRIRIQSNDGVTTRTHFTGFVSHIDPSSGDTGRRVAVIHAHGPEHWLTQNKIRLAPMTNVSADQVIEAVLDSCQLRRPLLDNYMIIGVTGYNTIGTNKLFGENIARSLESGKSSFAYVGDMWGEGISAADAIRQLAISERGRFFIDGSGRAVFYNRHHTLTDITPVATFSDDMEGMDYVYGADVINRVQITITPRSIGADNTLLWSLSQPQRLRPGITSRFVARYRDDNDNPVGALSLISLQPNTHYTATIDQEGMGADVTGYISVRIVEAGASSLLLEISHALPYVVYLQSLELRGTPLTSNDPLMVENADQQSITFYGLNALELDLPALTSIDEAEQMALYELGKRKDPRGIVQRLSSSSRSHPTESLSLTLFDRISITETQTNHSADYFIIAEVHDVDKGGVRHCVSWLLELADSERVAVIGDAKPDGSRVLAY
jgi:hypothetical protein